jgi:hypothetical protein
MTDIEIRQSCVTLAITFYAGTSADVIAILELARQLYHFVLGATPLSDDQTSAV